ncbi:methylglyoxal reductase (NADPH-dependent) gre2 [Pseudocyphellaria aurata]|nr:methylglyoxal reductase (NADPH-dependent) gre2 [Pseudocyphellaria aurata]
MTRILLTGPSGAVGAHVLEFLLARSHSVVATVTSQQNAEWLNSKYENVPNDKLDTSLTKPSPFELSFIPLAITVAPTSSIISSIELRGDRFYWNPESNLKERPAVKRVVITSSFAGMVDPDESAGKIYSELDWSPYTTAAEAPKIQAAGKRFFIVADKSCIQQFMELMEKNFPHLRDKLPTGALEPGGCPETGLAGFDDCRSVEVLGMTYTSFKESIVDTVKSFKSLPVGRTYTTVLCRKVRTSRARRGNSSTPRSVSHPNPIYRMSRPV